MLTRSQLEHLAAGGEPPQGAAERAEPVILLQNLTFHQQVRNAVNQNFHGSVRPPAPSELLTFLD